MTVRVRFGLGSWQCGRATIHRDRHTWLRHRGRTQHGHHIQNDNDGAIPQNCGARNTSDRRQLRTHRLHHNFTRADQLIHLNRNALIATTNQQYRQRQHMAHQIRRFHAMHKLAEIRESIGYASVFEQRRARCIVRLQLIRAGAHNTFNLRQWNGIAVFADAHHKGTIHRHRKRQTNDKGCALARFGLNRNHTAHLLDFGLHHIHANTTAGNLRHCGGG
jgi:hypothetical protein